MVYGHGCHMDAWRIKNASAPGSQRFRPGISVFRYDPVKPASDHPLCGQHTERAAPPFLRMSRLDRTCQFCSLFCSGCNEKADYMETLPVGQLLLAFTLILIFIHLFQYIRAGQNKADRILLLGLLTSIICTCVEGISVYFVTSLSGIFMGIGMLILLLSTL